MSIELRNRFLVACCALIALIGLSPSSQTFAVETIADLTEKAEKSVVRINVKTDDGESLGSGFVVDSIGIVVTNCHVVAGAVSAQVVFADNKAYPVDGTYLIDEARDIAILRINGSGFAPVKLSTQMPRKGEEVLAIGAPLGFDFTVTRGIVSAVRTSEQLKEIGLEDHAGTWIQVDVAISPGNSGGPIFNQSGEVIAMSTMGISNAQNLNFGISGVDISNAIVQAKKNSLKRLSDGAARITSSEKPSQGKDDLPSVPKKAILAYVDYGTKNFTKLVAALKKDIVEENQLLRDIRAGEVGLDIRRADGRSLDAGVIPGEGRFAG